MVDSLDLWQPSARNPACLLLLATALLYTCGKLTAPRLPPGPPAHPIVGHAFKVPPLEPWKKFAEWAKQYGDLLYIHVLGKPMLICNSFEVAKELMDKRGLNYSDRPPIMAAVMLGWENTLVLLRYNERWKKQRRIMQRSFDQQASCSFRPSTHLEVDKFIEDIANFNGNLSRRIHRLVASAISLCAYGHEVIADDDRLITQMEEVAGISTTVGTPGQTPVDFFPFLRFIPTWLPGTGYLKRLEAGKILTHNAFVTPVELVRKERELGVAKDSFISTLLEDGESEGERNKEHDEDIASLGGVIFLGGAETSESILNTFFLLMAIYPDVARRAQAELDEFTKTSRRLPTFSDRDRLPYSECLVKELYRYNPSLPLGIPHRAMQDDIYEGCTIPAGSMVVPNIKRMMRDERYYPDPDRFFPERFLGTARPLDPNLDKGGADPTKILFGFGRRICPGRFFADDLIWLTVASVLSVYDILPPLDPQTGKELNLVEEYTPDTVSRPKPYNCRVVPRAEKFEILMRSHGG